MELRLKDFKDYIESFDNGTEFNYGISKPFSWRGSYDEVAFAIIEKPMTRDDVLKMIDLAYSETFDGYKGGEYTYKDHTSVHFEKDTSAYTNGGYCNDMIAKIEGGISYRSQEDKLMSIAFT